MLSETGKKLADKLKQLYDNPDYICGVMSNAPGDENWKVLLNYMDTAERLSEAVTSDDILALSVALGENK
ncbi:ribonuclease HI [Clostridium sp. SY8519]|uniref:hypothetical protein n=1 Tax=Clostridium sp. (strain SY8519) TaxID=1042156 RepID=UPI000217165B|nr:hypothetical protein [Clostridium sp. SY8519]BAK46032.1 ribonuclease HI [Clostridium sp. SY8519]